ncbi:MAG TPA: hypothetical protein VGI61_09725, partial [Parafilimonas sp.]
GAIIGGVIGALSDKGNSTQGAINGALIGGGLALGSTYGNFISEGLEGAGRWIGHFFQNNSYWILYNGTNVILIKISMAMNKAPRKLKITQERLAH